MHLNTRFTLYLLITAGILQLSSCVVPPEAVRVEHETATPHSRSLEKKESLKTLLKRYERQAQAATTPADRQYYLLLAAETLMEHEQPQHAQKYYAHIEPDAVSAEHFPRMALLEAELAAYAGQYPVALQKLPKQWLDFPPKVQARILRVRAQALLELGYAHESLLARIRLSPLLENPDSVQRNNAAIWSVFTTLPETALQQLGKQHRDDDLHGWLALAKGLRNTAAQNREQFLTGWYTRYPAHPAAGRFLDKLRREPGLARYPANIALLLPLSSNNNVLSSAAEAIRDGFISAFYTHNSTSKPQIHIYDVGDDPEKIWTFQQQAQIDGAQIIVGPLDKKAVSNLVSAVHLEVPVLALNYTLEPSQYSSRVFQFGLLPEDEARQAAELAIIRGQTRALLLGPRNALTTRLQQAFSERFTSLGGQIIASELYADSAKSYADSVELALNLPQSQSRHAILRSIIKRDIKFEARRREDIDMVFLSGDRSQARSLKPLFAFYNAGDIPVYATSHIFNGAADPRLDRDLNGLLFVDAPWILKHEESEPYAALQNYWPEKFQQNARHFALGLDAYRLIPHLDNLQQNPFERFPGHTGSISIDSQNRIHRELIWAEFDRGKVSVLDYTQLESVPATAPEYDNDL